MARYKPAPISGGLWSPGVLVLLALMLVGLCFGIARFYKGIGYVSNLTNAYPWGLWVAVDIAAGVALAAGGFVTVFLVHITGRDYYKPIVRPALLTALLGYTVVALGLLVDVGRYWAMWHPLVYWQPNSVLFEIAICVSIYLVVLYHEFLPIIVERYHKTAPFLEYLVLPIKKIMPLLLVCGVVLSCFHQSGLGTLMLIAPTKVHPLWYSPYLPLMFILSAIAVGFPMVVFETVIAANTLKRESDIKLFGALSWHTLFLLGIYMALKIWDMIERGTTSYLLDGSVESNAFMVEVIAGVIIPWLLLWLPQIRRSRRGVFMACSLIVGGVIFNRINVFLVAYSPPFGGHTYYPAIGEIAISAGLIASIMFFYRLGVALFPLLESRTP
jgi:Ni/Fe-hydrogenase subunit HybB-like protein